jgi:glycine C-acetyltransferase
LDEPWRIKKLNDNSLQFIDGLKSAGFNTLFTETAIVPVICGDDETAFMMTRECQMQNVFVLPVISPAVPPGLSRLRATITAAHDADEIDHAMEIIIKAGHKLGVLEGAPAAV